METSIGVDIISRDPRTYAIVIVSREGNKILPVLKESGSRLKLLKLIKNYSPVYMGIDSTEEFSKNDLERLSKYVSIVQVTGKFDDFTALPVIAKRFKININPKNPFDEAYALSVLPLEGVGYKLKLYEDETEILVSSGRSLGRGGYSQGRYQRRTFALIKYKVREIEKILKDEGFNFDVDVIEREGGFSKGVFRVYSNFENISVKSSRGDIRIDVRPLKKSFIEYEPVEKKVETSNIKDKYIIVGVDPGTTVGLSALDLEGNILAIISKRSFSMSDVKEEIRKYGYPLIFASDVNPPSGFIEKLSTSFDSILYLPQLSIPVKEKNELTKELSVTNAHERDSLSAAIKAYINYKNKFVQIKSKIPEELSGYSSRIIGDVLRGMSIKEAIDKLREELTKKEDEIKIEQKPLEEVVIEQLKIIDNYKEKQNTLKKDFEKLEAESTVLKRKLEEKESTIISLERKLFDVLDQQKKEALKDNVIKSKNFEIASLRKSLDLLKAKVNSLTEENKRLKELKPLMESEDITIGKVLTVFSVEGIRHLVKNMDLMEGDVVYLKDPTGGGAEAAKLLSDIKIKAILFTGKLSHQAQEEFVEGEIPLIDSKDIKMEVIAKFVLLDKEKFELVYKREKELLLAFKKAKESNKLLKIIEDYKEQRKSDFKA
jgi:predicted RNase H-like nuclease (RuvC/YqgF family)